MDDTNKQQSDSPFPLTTEYRSRLIASIERKLHIIKEAPTTNDYFLQIGEFFKYISGNEVINIALKQMLEEFKQSQKEFDELRVAMGEQTNSVFSNLLGLIKTHKILSEADVSLIDGYYNGTKKITKDEADRLNNNSSAIFRSLVSYYSWARGKSQSLGNELIEFSLLGAVESLVRALYDSEHKSFVEKYVLIDNSDSAPRVIGYRVAPLENKLREMQETIKYKTEASPWFAYKRINLVLLCLYDYPDFIGNLEKENKIAERMNLIGLIGELREVMDGKKLREALYFRKELYDSYLLRVVDKIIDLFDVMEQMPQSSYHASTEVQAEEIVPMVLLKRPQQLPTDVNGELVSKYSYIENKDTGGYILQYGEHKSVPFGANDDMGTMMNIFSAYKEQWINYEILCKFMWPDRNYQNLSKEKNIPIHQIMRRIIGDIRDKKLKPHKLDEKILLQSGKVDFGPVGEGWYRLHFVAP